MSVWGNIAGTWREGVMWQNVSGTWRKTTMWGKVAGAWKKDPDATGGGGTLSAVTDPMDVYGSVARKTAAVVSTNYTNVVASGGTAPYTYSWAAVAGWTVLMPTSSYTSFSSSVPPGDEKTAQFTCTVTDAKGATTATVVSAEVANYYSGGINADI